MRIKKFTMKSPKNNKNSAYSLSAYRPEIFHPNIDTRGKGHL
jgi:hypothetical protein